MPGNTNSGTIRKQKQKHREDIREPEMYKVILHNDHYTTMEFVVEILVSIFNKNVLDAVSIMMDVHMKGRGVVGLYTYDIANTKAKQVMKTARDSEYPLKCTVEKA
jgi:ATP-dependent Clp protease adaptor protein ClpS